MHSFVCLCLISALPLSVAAQAPSAPTSAAPDSAAPASARPAPEPRVVADSREGLGARLMISVYSADERGAKAAIDVTFARMLEIEARLANYVPTSEVSRVNQAAGKAPVGVSHATIAVVNRGLALSRESSHAFALTTAALESLWDFAKGKPKKPDPRRVRERLALIDDNQVVVDAENSSIFIKNPHASMSVNGLMLGLAADEAIAFLNGLGFADALVFAGGDIRASGKKGTNPWVVGVQDPRAIGYFAVTPLQNEGIATVGDYQRYVEIDGERFCHILDPRSGMPANAARSATVLAHDATSAHLFATAIFVLGTDPGLKLLANAPDISALIVDAQNGVTVSPGLKDRLRIVRPPSN
jgi:FAD:protein FMN transferase